MSNKEKNQAKEKQEFDLNFHAMRLLIKEPFFAALSRRINKIKTTAISTAGVSINKETNQFDLLYNPDFMGSLTDTQKLGVLKHEFYHLVFEHVTGRKPIDPKMSKIWNIAADLAINSYLENELPEGCCIPGVGNFANYKKDMTAEAYFESLKKDVQNQQNENDDHQSSSSEQFDSHEGWSSEDIDNAKKALNEENEDAAKERLKDILRKAVQESQECGGWGSVSAAFQKEILERLRSRVDWRKMLRYFIKTSQRADKSSTPRRINKRYPYIHSGKKVNRQANIAICIDQSGSVSDELLALFFNELNKFSEIATFTVIPHDCQIYEDKIFVWKRNQKIKANRVLCGGTDFNSPTEYVNKHNFDGTIFLTDLEAPKPKACKCKRIWMTDIHHANQPYFRTHERIIAIDK